MNKNLSEFIAQIAPSAVFQEAAILTVHLDKRHIIEVLLKLKSDFNWRFTILTDLFAADFPSKPARFEVVYNLLSLKLNSRLVLKTHVADNEPLPSATEVFAAANWYEREIFDMFGVAFDGHPNLERILTDYGFDGHPLRKDFPLSGYVQVKYDEKLEQVVYEPVDLDQEFRDFDFVSPWLGPVKPLPGDEKATELMKKK